MKIILVILLLAIMVALFSGLFFLIRGDDGKSKRTVNALTWRVGLQVALIVILVVAVLMGWIRPHGVYYETPETTPANSEQTE